MNICVYGASSNRISESYIKAGELLGKVIAMRGHTVVYGGGAEGMMGAIARGSIKNGGKVIGIAPSFFKVDGCLYDKCTEFIYTETMSERKTLLEDMSDAFITTPGGPGTYDEFFETFTLKQLDKHRKPITLFNINGYFDLLNEVMEQAIRLDFMKEKNRENYFISADAEEIVKYIENYKPTDVNIADFKNITTGK